MHKVFLSCTTWAVALISISQRPSWILFNTNLCGPKWGWSWGWPISRRCQAQPHEGAISVTLFKEKLAGKHWKTTLTSPLTTPANASWDVGLLVGCLMGSKHIMQVFEAGFETLHGGSTIKWGCRSVTPCAFSWLRSEHTDHGQSILIKTSSWQTFYYSRDLCIRYLCKTSLDCK